MRSLRGVAANPSADVANLAQGGYAPSLGGDNPWAAYRWFRQHAPVWREEGGSVYHVFDFSGVKELLASPLASVQHPFRISRQVFGRTLLDMHGEEHRHLRRAYGQLINGHALAAIYDGVVSPRVDALMAKLRDAPRFEMVTDVASVLPIQMTCDLLCIPDERAAWVAERLTYLVSQLETSSRDVAVVARYRDELRMFLLEHLQSMSSLHATSRSSDAGVASLELWNQAELSIAQRLELAMLTLAAGVETSTAMLVNAGFCLIKFRSNWQRHSNEVCVDALAEAIQESARWLPAQHDTVRFAASDLELAGCRIPRGCAIRLNLASANRDASQAEDAEQFNAQRAVRLTTLSFGHGPHSCLGRALALLGLRSFFQRLLHFARAIELGPEVDEGLTGITFRHLRRVPVEVVWK